MLHLWKIIVSLYLISIDLTTIYGDNVFCNARYCNNTRNHIMCEFQFEGPARRCIHYERTIKTESDKRHVLEKINSRRNKIAVGEISSLRPAENMMKLKWNEELAIFAQRWADQCVKYSVPDTEDNCRDLENYPVGQNIATIYGDSPGLTPMSLVDLWYIELLNVNLSIISQYQRSQVTTFDHYDYFTQLMWAESNQVGCGAVKFKELIKGVEDIKNRTVYRLVCNFAPAGNQIGRAVYSDGLPCSRCPSSATCDSEYKAICAQDISNDATLEQDDTPVELRQYIRTQYFPVTESNMGNTNEENITKDIAPLLERTIDYDENISYNFFSDFLESTPTSSTVHVTNDTICKDVFVVDELYNLLKKKLKDDQSLRELLLTSKPSQIRNADETFTDPTVAAIVSRVYSKRESTTTAKITNNEYINSTLLVDLVEAVIFRSNDKIPTSEVTEANTPLTLQVNPVKIQAELAEIGSNSEFTGHYFFPEDSNEPSESDKINNYYDNSDFPLSDVPFEIEELRRNKGTKDFLEEILESDFITDTASLTYNNENTAIEINNT